MPTGFLKLKRQLPKLGIGLGLRRDMAKETLEHRAQIGFLELVPENYMGVGGKAREVLSKAASAFPLISHGVNLSIGSTDELNFDYLKELKALLDEYNIAWFSDHLCFTSVEGGYLHDLLPVPFSKSTVKHIVERVKRVQDFVGRPFLLENISYYMYLPGQDMTEGEFTTEILEQADCGLLLDVNNVYVNAVNHGFDAHKFLDTLPLERVVQIHIAGHKMGKELIIDTHGAPVIEPVFKLLDTVLRKTSVCGVLLERDQNFPDFDEILTELAEIRKVAEKAQPELVRGDELVRAH
ncbi:MAG: DUF692 domain-containing protein [Candidatus Obscuribacterales bacterium]|nr:DUF692 domain-containing protein [Candidatus Obscuribacterales bacterium]